MKVKYTKRTRYKYYVIKTCPRTNINSNINIKERKKHIGTERIEGKTRRERLNEGEKRLRRGVKRNEAGGMN